MITQNMKKLISLMQNFIWILVSKIGKISIVKQAK